MHGVLADVLQGSAKRQISTSMASDNVNGHPDKQTSATGNQVKKQKSWKKRLTRQYRLGIYVSDYIAAP